MGIASLYFVWRLARLLYGVSAGFFSLAAFSLYSLYIGCHYWPGSRSGIHDGLLSAYFRPVYPGTLNCVAATKSLATTTAFHQFAFMPVAILSGVSPVAVVAAVLGLALSFSSGEAGIFTATTLFLAMVEVYELFSEDCWLRLASDLVLLASPFTISKRNARTFWCILTKELCASGSTFVPSVLVHNRSGGLSSAVFLSAKFIGFTN